MAGWVLIEHMQSTNPRHQVSWLAEVYLVGPLSGTGFIQKFWHREFWDGCRFLEDLWTTDMNDHGCIISPVLLIILAVHGKNAMSDIYALSL